MSETPIACQLTIPFGKWGEIVIALEPDTVIDGRAADVFTELLDGVGAEYELNGQGENQEVVIVNIDLNYADYDHQIAFLRSSTRGSFLMSADDDDGNHWIGVAEGEGRILERSGDDLRGYLSRLINAEQSGTALPT